MCDASRGLPLRIRILYCARSPPPLRDLPPQHAEQVWPIFSKGEIKGEEHKGGFCARRRKGIILFVVNNLSAMICGVTLWRMKFRWWWSFVGKVKIRLDLWWTFTEAYLRDSIKIIRCSVAQKNVVGHSVFVFRTMNYFCTFLLSRELHLLSLVRLAHFISIYVLVTQLRIRCQIVFVCQSA